jgi:hypothetical protein
MRVRLVSHCSKLRLIMLGHSIIARLAMNISLLSACRIPDLNVAFHGISGGWTFEIGSLDPVLGTYLSAIIHGVPVILTLS